MSGWLLKKIEIEGFRGINNHGRPLELEFKIDKVNSVFATNGVGKSSIFDAITFALTGGIPKLDSLPAVESGELYYLNKFHPGQKGTVSLTLSPDAGGSDVVVTVTRDAFGARTIATSDGRDGSALLAEINREFVLLDAKTFQKFIEDRPLDRGRSFAGLLGLGAYSALRRYLQTASNTRAFNNHFGVSQVSAEKKRAQGTLGLAEQSVADSYALLTGETYRPESAEADLKLAALASLSGIALIAPECQGKDFMDVSPTDCLALVREAEGGKDRDRLSELIQGVERHLKAVAKIPAEEHQRHLIDLTASYEEALGKTRGENFLKLFEYAAKIVDSPDWGDKQVCPACDRRSEEPLHEHFKEKLSQYEASKRAHEALQSEWVARGWGNAAELEALVSAPGSTSIIHLMSQHISNGSITKLQMEDFVKRVQNFVSLSSSYVEAQNNEKAQIEGRLPASLVSVTEKVEAARRLQQALRDRSTAAAELELASSKEGRIQRIKAFLDTVTSGFSNAEATAAARRLEAVEPTCRDHFSRIMFENVVPSIKKPVGSEEILLGLDSFHSMSGVSAQSVLSESYRNAFAISVYMAAASLFGGAPRFMILDDVTSSFDGGHQFHLMQVIASFFARPGVAGGPQVILLSHDTLLEKYFNSQVNSGIWWHQRIEGSPRTAVLPQSNAVNHVRDSMMSYLNSGNAIEAGPRIRQYLEYKLQEVIASCRIPVPIDIAVSDDKKLCSNLIDAIKAAVKLHEAANSLVLTDAQKVGLTTATQTIVSNYLAHWGSGQAATFTAPALRGVVQAIDDFVDCFRYVPATGGNPRYYKSLSVR